MEGKEGIGVWLAKRGVTFIGLTRVGRWNFLAPDGSGSWKDIPLDQRMPIFNRDQKVIWSPDDYTGMAYLYRTAKQGNFTLPYDRSALRVRERGTPDFDVYTKGVPQDIKDAWWQNALKSPRFKSVEDSTMMFGAAALAEMAARLWMADFLPAEYRKEGFAKFIQSFFEPSFPPAELKKVPVLEMNGTKDEVLPPNVVDAHREVMEPYYAKCRVARVDGFGHYLFKQENNKVVGSLWLKFIDSGYFDRRK